MKRKEICVYTKKELVTEKNASKDIKMSKEHIIPAALGGKKTIYISESVNNSFSEIENRVITAYFKYDKVNNGIGKRGNKENLKTNLIVAKVDGKEFLGYRDSNGRFFDNGLSQILLNETLFPETFQGKNDSSIEKEEKEEKEFIEVVKKKLIEKKYKIIEFKFERKQVIIVQELDNEYLIIAVQTNEIIENKEIEIILKNLSYDFKVKEIPIVQKNNIDCKETYYFNVKEMEWFVAKIGFNIFAYLDSEKRLILKEIFDPLRNYILNKILTPIYLTCEIKIENRKNIIFKQEINKFIELGIFLEKSFKEIRNKNIKIFNEKFNDKSEGKHVLIIYKNHQNLEGILKLFEDYHHIIFTDKLTEEFEEISYSSDYV